jgi:phospholipid-binding lipoprotein MlaA
MRGLIAAMSVAAAYVCAPALAHAQAAAGAPSTPNTSSTPDASVTADANVDQDAQSGGRFAIPDPWEDFNRNMYGVNDAADKAVLEPVARGYRAVAPQFVRTGVSNFLHNLGAPVILVNDVLQGEIGRAGVTVARFGINSTLGVLGLLDPATDFGFQRHDDDFGQTLAVWGVGPGPYLFVPLLGPTTVRDGAGHLVDLAFDPLNWARFRHADEVRAARIVVGAISTREELLDPVDAMRRTSIDPYSTVRATYQLTRESEILHGAVDDEESPNLDNSTEPAGAGPAGAATTGAGPTPSGPTSSQGAAPNQPGAGPTPSDQHPVNGAQSPSTDTNSTPSPGDKK